MVAGKVKMAMGLQKSPANLKHINNNPSPKPPSSSPSPTSNSATSNGTNKHQSQKGSRPFGAYFPRSSAQVQPRPPDVSELLRLVEELRERESRLRTELLEQKLLKESVAIVPVLENQIWSKDFEIEKLRKKVGCLEVENEQLRREVEFLHSEFSKQNVRQEMKVRDLEGLVEDLKKGTQDLALLSQNVCPKSLSKPMRKCFSQIQYSRDENIGTMKSENEVKKQEVQEIMESSENELIARSRAPHVPKPPPRPSSSLLSGATTSSSSYSSIADSAERALSEISNIPPPPPPPPKVCFAAEPPPPPASRAAPPPPPPPPAKGSKGVPAKVRRVPEVVEFYHSLMRRDTRRESGGGVAEGTAPATAAKDMIGEIENRSAYLLAIKSDVETQGDFIRFLIKEVENAVFADIEDVVPFVKWLDDELSFLVDERAVLKHFDWPEKKADALREAAFGYCDLKKLESQASSFSDDLRQQPSAPALKKMQGLFEKLEHGVYNLSRMRETAANRYKGFNIPTEWMQDTGLVSQIKWASVKLAMKYIKRVSAELETVGGCGPEEEELIVQGVRFAFRVHQFAGGFDVDTMRAFQELRDKARSCHVQWQNQLHQKT